MSSPEATTPSANMSENKREQRDRSNQIDKQIEEDSKKYRKECKILLLGTLLSPALPRLGKGHLLMLMIRLRKAPESRARVQ
jgi:hypothetical protein